MERQDSRVVRLASEKEQILKIIIWQKSISNKHFWVKEKKYVCLNSYKNT